MEFKLIPDAPSTDEKGYKLTPDRHVGRLEDFGRSLTSGLATGVASIPGAIGDLSTLGNLGINKAVDYLGPKMGYKPEDYQWLKSEGSPYFPTTEDVKKTTGLDKTDYDPQYTTGKLTKNITELVPGAMMGGASTVKGLAGNVAKFGIAPGVAVTGAEEYAPDMPGARVVAGLATPLVTHHLMSPGRGFRSVPATEQSYADHVARVREAVPGASLSPAEVQNSRQMRYFEDMIDPEKGYRNREAVTEAATGQVTRGDGTTYATKTIKHGEDGTVDTMLKEVGKRYDDLNARNVFDVSGPHSTFGGDMANTVHEYNAHPGQYPPEVVNMVDAWDKRLDKAVRLSPTPGVIPGKEYQDILKDLRKQRMNATGDKATALKKIEDNMTKGMEDSIGATNKADLGKYKQTDIDYKNAQVIGHAAEMGSSATHLSPDAIVHGSKNVYGPRGHERGYSPFDWATSAKAVMREVPDSGTAHRGFIHAANKAIGQALGAAAGYVGGAHVGMHEPLAMQLALEPIGAAIGQQILPAIERPIYNAASPYLRNRWTAEQAAPVRSVPGLLTGTSTSSNEERRRPRLSVNVPLTPEEIAKRTPRRTSARGLLNQFPGGEE